MNINILNKKYRCLLDCGANISVAGNSGILILENLGFNIDKRYLNSMNTVDKTSHFITGIFYIPIKYNGEVKVLIIHAVPSIGATIILGVNFWKTFEILLYHNNERNAWSVSAIESSEKQLENARIVDQTSLSREHKAVLENINNQFENMSKGKLGRTHLLEHFIDTGNEPPIKQRSYPVSPPIQARLKKELDRMIELDVVEPSYSPWSSPVVLVKKKDGRDRMCLDYRKINTVTKKDSYPLPRVSEILDRLGKTRYLSSIDLKDAYWQIPLTGDSKEKTAFVVPGMGLWQFKVLPYGLSNSAQFMQRLMAIVFVSTEHRVFVYLDDLIIATESFQEHMETLKFVLERLRFANLTINYEKCKFCQSSLKYLGFVVDNGGLRTDPSKVESIVNYKRPHTYTDNELKRFIGMTSWYRRFIKNFAIIASPLSELTKGRSKGKIIKWNDETETAFLQLKQALVSSPVLITPDFEKNSVHCDASNSGIGAVLCQGEEEALVSYASRKFRGCEKVYSTTEKELLAVLFAIETF